MFSFFSKTPTISNINFEQDYKVTTTISVVNTVHLLQCQRKLDNATQFVSCTLYSAKHAKKLYQISQSAAAIVAMEKICRHCKNLYILHKQTLELASTLGECIHSCTHFAQVSHYLCMALEWARHWLNGNQEHGNLNWDNLFLLKNGQVVAGIPAEKVAKHADFASLSQMMQLVFLKYDKQHLVDLAKNFTMHSFATMIAAIQEANRCKIVFLGLRETGKTKLFQFIASQDVKWEPQGW